MAPKPEYPRVDCVYGWCPHRVKACETCDEIKRITREKMAAHLPREYQQLSEKP